MRPNMSLPQWLKTVLGQNQKIVVCRPDDSHSPLIRRSFRFSGLVQGVGFRYEAKITADELGLVGWAKNEDDGTVTIEAEGTEVCIDEFIRVMRSVPRFRITNIQSEELPVSGVEASFRVFY